MIYQKEGETGERKTKTAEREQEREREQQQRARNLENKGVRLPAGLVV